MPIGLQNNWMRSKGLDPSKKFMHQLNKIFARDRWQFMFRTVSSCFRLLF
jgi:hypothetical protein